MSRLSWAVTKERKKKEGKIKITGLPGAVPQPLFLLSGQYLNMCRLYALYPQPATFAGSQFFLRLSFLFFKKKLGIFLEVVFPFFRSSFFMGQNKVAYRKSAS